MINYILLVSRQGSLAFPVFQLKVLILMQERSAWRNGSQQCPQRQRQKLSRMSHNSSSLDGHGCAIFWNTKAVFTSLLLFLYCMSAYRRPTDTKVVYRRYASLFFICGIGSADNELVTLEIIHRYVEVLDRYFGNVSTPPAIPSVDY